MDGKFFLVSFIVKLSLENMFISIVNQFSAKYCKILIYIFIEEVSLFNS